MSIASNMLLSLPELLPANRNLAAQVQKVPQLQANHDYAKGVLTIALAARPQLPKPMQAQVDAFARSVRRFDVLRALVENDIRRGVRAAIAKGRLTEAHVAQFPEGMRGLGAVPLLVIAFGVALAIVVSLGATLGLTNALKEWLTKDSAVLAEAKLIDKSLADLNKFRRDQGLPPVVYTPGQLTGGNSILPLVLLGGGAVVLLMMLRKRRNRKG